MSPLWLLPCLAAIVVAQNSTSAQNATTFALVYGYPLLAWQRYAGGVIDDVGTNNLHHARELSTPANRTVVKPNVDTLYSNLIYDLSDSDLVINVPDVPADDFKLFSFYDPYGVNWANVGTGGFFRKGSYLLRYDPAGSSGLRITNGTNQSAQLTAPSPYGTLLIRWGVNSSNEETVHQYQDSTSVRTTKREDNVFSLEMMPALESLISAYNTSASPAENVLSLLARYEETNAYLSAQLQAAGISDGNYEPQSSVNLTLANSTAIAQVAASGTDPDSIVTLNEGWFVLSPDLIGVYGTNYALRTAIADSGYLALRNPFAVYPTWSNGSDSNATGTFEIGSDEAIIFTFSGKPPLQQAGFWSLTTYNGNYFLIPNEIETYALGDRSNITYPDGSPVYGPEADASKNGTFQILMQPADVAPPSNWTNNWLPAPSGGGAIVPQLRFFAAEEAESDGQYKYPSLTRMRAVREGSGDASGNGTSSGGQNSASSSPSGTAGGGAASSSLSASSSPSASPNRATRCWALSSSLTFLAVAVGMINVQ